MASNDSNFVTGYQAYETDGEEDAPINDADDDESAPIFLHSDAAKPAERWHHIENLDDFFTRIYTYHQRHGLLCMVVEDCLQIVQFLLIVVFSGFLIDCIDYDILFARRTPEMKQTFHDVIKTPCSCGFEQPQVAICMIIAFSFAAVRFFSALSNIFKYWEIGQFYRVALEISASDLENKTWSEIQTKLLHVQKDVQMCIHKNELTSLDVYHRILRYKNFFISMVNKSVLPLKIRLPIVGEFHYLTHGLRFNLEWLLFWRPFHFNVSPFKNPYYIRPEYKTVHSRMALSQQLSRRILLLGLLNLLLSPIILLWHVLYFFFVYGNMMKRDPGFLGSRKWSMYGRSFMRHFNELDHELDSRLCKAYAVGGEYMNGFMSPLLAIVGRFISFVAGAVLVVIVCLTWYDEDTLQIEHMLTLMGTCGLLLAVGQAFVPPENLVFVPEAKMTEILAHTHYQPNHWKERAHTSQVRDEFGQLFQLKAVILLQELVSPLITPLMLIFQVRHNSLQIVDFYRNFTVEAAGVGDICSFAQLDIRKHGNRKWSSTGAATSDTYQQAEHGKTELSLMHFSLMNPEWNPPEESHVYLSAIKESAVRDADAGLSYSINSMSTSLAPRSSRLGAARSYSSSSAMFKPGGMYGSTRPKQMAGSMSQHAGPATGQPVGRGVLDAVRKSFEGSETDDINTTEYNSHEMSLSVLYMHELKRRNQLATIGHTGYENLENRRQVMTDSELHPVAEFHSVNEEFGADSSSCSPQSRYSTTENL